MILILTLFHLLGEKVAHGAFQSGNIKGQNCNDRKIDVVSFVNLDEKIGSLKKSLDDVPSLAVLTNDNGPPLPLSFTICSDIMNVFSKKEHRLMFFNMLANNGEQLLPALLVGDNFLTTSIASGNIPTVFANQWVKSCMAIDTFSGMIQWVVDGNLVQNKTVIAPKDFTIPNNLNGKIILGAYQTQVKLWWVLSGKLTNLNIFSGLLPLPVLQKRTNGDSSCLEEGDYLGWSEMKWELRGTAIIEQIRQSELNTKPILNLYSAQFKVTDCKHFCENLGAQMPSVSNNEELERLQGFCEAKMKLPSSGLWVAADDFEEEGLWKESLTGQPLNYTPPWAPNEPNGGTKENCAGFEGFCQWLDLPCNDWTYFCLCENKPRPILKLLGLCKESLIDRGYQPRNDVKDIETLNIVGHSTSIRYDPIQMLWMLSVVHHNVTGTSLATHKSFTLGKNTWTIIGDKGCGKGSHSYKVKLKMTGCKDGNFTCNDGQCVSMTKRCDHVPNCRDESDEKGCNILVLKEGFNRRVPPVGKNEDDKVSPVPVKVSMTLLKVVDIKEEDYSIELQIQITLEWKEIRQG